MYTQDQILEKIKKLKMPVGYNVDDDGIYIEAERNGYDINWQRISATPLLIIKQLMNIKSGIVKYELAYRINSTWYVTVQNTDFFIASKIVSLAGIGINVSSNNAGKLVRFLEAVHKVNESTLERSYTTDCFGWINDKSYLPYADNGIKLDIDSECRVVAEGYRAEGDLNTWINYMSKLRKNIAFRFLLASAAAAPLLRILNQRSFFVYNWAASKSGKTAALKAALSIWGQPEEIMGNFNATQVGLEHMAALFNDLPLGLDERQLAGGKQQEQLESIVYMISSGHGRWRGKKEGGLQKNKSWRTIVLSTGEEPIQSTNSHNGVTTRIIELYSSPFHDELSAAQTHQFVEVHHGLAGVELAKFYVTADKEELMALYQKICDSLMDSEFGFAHTTSVAVIALADAIMDSIFFDEATCARLSTKSVKRAIKMAKDVLDAARTHSNNDVNANAVQYIMDWILSNKNAFDDEKGSGIRYGFTENDIYYILPSCMDEALRHAGYSPRKTRAYMLEKELIAKEEIDGYINSTVVKRHNGTRARYIEFRGLADSTKS